MNGYKLLSEELAPLAVGQDYDKDGGGERCDQEEAPEEPFVDYLRQEPPLPPNLSQKLINVKYTKSRSVYGPGGGIT